MFVERADGRQELRVNKRKGKKYSPIPNTQRVFLPNVHSPSKPVSSMKGAAVGIATGKLRLDVVGVTGE